MSKEKTDANLEDTLSAIRDILSAPDTSSPLWPILASEEFRKRIQAKTDACAAFMLQTMVDCVTLYKRKNTDYGDAFGKTYAQFGSISALIRIADKINRITSLMERGDIEQKVLDESVKDTLMDLVNYSLMTMYEMKQEGKW